MPETPRTDRMRRVAEGVSHKDAQANAQFLIAEMLERIAIALEKEEKDGHA